MSGSWTSPWKPQAWQPGPWGLWPWLFQPEEVRGQLSLPLAAGRQGLGRSPRTAHPAAPQPSTPTRLCGGFHRPACKHALGVSVCSASPAPTQRCRTSTPLLAPRGAARAPHPHAAWENSSGGSRQVSLLQGSLAPGWVTVLVPLPASQSPTGSGWPCLWIRKSMASLFSGGRELRPGWGRGLSRGDREQPLSPGPSRPPCSSHAEKRVLCWVES